MGESNGETVTTVRFESGKERSDDAEPEPPKNEGERSRAGDSAESGGSDLPAWLKIGAAVAGLITTVASTYSAVQSKHNGDAIGRVALQAQTNLNFAKEMAGSRQYFKDRTTAVEAMIESLRLYTLADTIPKKLAIIEIVSDTNQTRALLALSPLIGEDQQVQHPSDDDLAGASAIQEIVRQLSRTADQPKKDTPAAGVSSDPPLTNSRNDAVRANARVLTALPQPKSSGYIFAGDALRSDPVAGRFELASATTSAPGQPHINDRIIACKDINVREEPFYQGRIGPLVTVVPRGTNLQVVAADPDTPVKFDTVSKFSNRTISAWWCKVNVLDRATPPDVAAKCPGAVAS